MGPIPGPSPTQATSFEPLEEAPIKYVTWKTVFLLALASGKRRSEIHAWTLDGLLCLGDWDQIQLTPSPSFIAKNQLAKEGIQAVSPVVIPTLKTTQNNSNEDILLCPVRALSIYLKLTSELRQDKILLFVSYKQGHSKDIQCSPISSWIKNTIKFCYSRVGDLDMDRLGVKAYDVRAFAASKAFYGVSLWTKFSKLAIGNLTKHLHLSISRTYLARTKKTYLST